MWPPYQFHRCHFRPASIISTRMSCSTSARWHPHSTKAACCKFRDFKKFKSFALQNCRCIQCGTLHLRAASAQITQRLHRQNIPTRDLCLVSDNDHNSFRRIYSHTIVQFSASSSRCSAPFNGPWLMTWRSAMTVRARNISMQSFSLTIQRSRLEFNSHISNQSIRAKVKEQEKEEEKKTKVWVIWCSCSNSFL